MGFENFIAALTTLFVVLDPIATAPIFLSLTIGMAFDERRRIAAEASLIAASLLTGAALIGGWLLAQLGIGLPAFRIAGGILLFAIAYEMVLNRRGDRKADGVQDVPAPHLAAFPLGIPLIAGPGAITACVLLASKHEGNTLALTQLIGLIVFTVACCFVLLALAARFESLIGRATQIVFSRLMGVILSALAVQFIVDGIAGAYALWQAAPH